MKQLKKIIKDIIKSVGILVIHTITITTLGLFLYLFVGENEITWKITVLFIILEFISMILILWLAYYYTGIKKSLTTSIADTISFIISLGLGILSGSFVDSSYISTLIGLLVYLVIMLLLLRLTRVVCSLLQNKLKNN